jgi:radical SAM protein with 4Fe4S-binding SPASM domain
MYYKLTDNYALRKWKKIGEVLYNLKTASVETLSIFNFITLRDCDGETYCEKGELFDFFERRGVITRCAKGDAIRDEQRFRDYPNEFFPIVQWAVTNRCNYKCRHCFMASSAGDETAEPSHEACMALADQIADCGIRAAYLTGGEPLLRSDFLSIMDKLTERGVYVNIISTNGSLLNERLLSEIKRRNVRPIFVLSFDGLGCHDWMRRVSGAEEESIRAMKLAREHGFELMVEMAVHDGNADVAVKTADFVNSIGASAFKMIRVADSPRWKIDGSPGLPCGDYYDLCLETLREHRSRGWDMDIKLVGFVFYYKSRGSYEVLPVKGGSCVTEHSVLCRKARSILFIAGDGRVLPCNPFTGMAAGREDMGNVFETPLAELLSNSDYLSHVNASVTKLRGHNAKCAHCAYFADCLGGCRALAYAATGDYLGADPTKCEFFEKGYLEKVQEAMEGVRPLNSRCLASML